MIKYWPCIGDDPNLVLETFVAGLVYYDYQKVRLFTGQRISLEYESTNPFDPNAIKVLVVTGKRRVHIGYVPRDMTDRVRDYAGEVTRAFIRNYAPTNATHRMVLIRVIGKPGRPQPKVIV